MSIARQLNTRGNTVYEYSRSLLRRAIYANEPGTTGSLPSASELRELDQRIQAWRQELEQFLARFESTAPATAVRDALLIPQLGLVNSWLQLNANLHLSLVSARQPVSDATLQSWRIRLPTALARTLEANLAQEANSLIQIRWAGTAADVSLKRDFFTGQEASALSHSGPYGPETGALLQFTQIQSIRQGLQAQAAIQDLLGPEVHLPRANALPSALQRLAPSLTDLAGQSAELQQSIHRLRLREGLTITFVPQRARLLPATLINEDLVRRILSTQITSRSRGVTPESVGLLQTILQEREREFRAQVPLQVAGELPADSTLLLQKLRAAAEDWALSPLYEALTEQQNLGTLEFSPQAQQATEQTIQGVKEQLRNGLTDTALQGWLDQAQAQAELLRLDHRHRWVAEIYRAARAVTGRTAPRDFDPVALLLGVLASRPLSPEFRATYADQLVQLMRGDSGASALTPWEAVRRVLGERLATLCAGQRILVNGLPNLAYAERCYANHDFHPAAARYATMPASVATHLRNETAERARAEVRALIEVVRTLNLSRRTVPTGLHDFTLEAKDREAYAAVLQSQAADRFPFLSLELPARHPGVRANPETLAAVLARQSTQDNLDANGIATVWQVLEPALRLLDVEVRNRMSRIANATDWNSIRADARLLVSEQLLLNAGSAYAVTRQTLESRITQASPVDLLFERYLDPYVTEGLTALLVIQIANGLGRRILSRRYGPLGTALSEVVIEPVSNAFFQSLLVFGTLHTAYLGHAATEAEALAAAASSTANADFLGLGSPSYAAALAYRGDAEHQRFIFNACVVGDVLGSWVPYIAWPLLRPLAQPVINSAASLFLVRQIGAASPLVQQDIRAMFTLGLPPGVWEAEAIRAAAREARSAGGVSAEVRGTIDHAEDHLLSRLRGGSAPWTIWNLLMGTRAVRSLTPTESRLTGLLRRGA